MYIKLIRYSTYNLDIFFDKDDRILDKIKSIIFSGNSCSTIILIKNNKINIEYLPIDVYKLSFIDNENNKHTSKYNYGMIVYNTSINKDYINAKDIDLKELLSNEHKIILGSLNNIVKWNFNLDNKLCMRIIFDLLECIPYTNNIYKFVREIGKLVNYNDDYGIICGNWNSNISLIENKSLYDILQIYSNKFDDKPLFGQCFTFAAVLCGILRHINIPSRCVTCFNAIHNGDLDGNIEELQGGFQRFCNNPATNKDDFVWNFHVWVECFINGSWYAIDSSPVYTNDINECIIGPAKLFNIKNNLYNDDNCYDSKVFSATVDNINKNNNKNKNISIYTNYKNKIIDITKNYKYI